jgi:hypothetical protein
MVCVDNAKLAIKPLRLGYHRVNECYIMLTAKMMCCNRLFLTNEEKDRLAIGAMYLGCGRGIPAAILLGS